MALDINGYNDTFQKFANFAQGESAAGRNKSIAAAGVKVLKNRIVGDKAEALCGAVHREQASSVLMLLSQSGLGNLLGGLKGHGIGSTEHSAVDYKLTKNERTGAITIHYSSPEVLPFKFKWTAKVDVYGNVSSAPMKFEMPVENPDAGALTRPSAMARFSS